MLALLDTLDVENRINELRKKAGLTLEQLALRANTTPAQVQRLEAGTRRLSDHWMGRLAPALGVEPVELIANIPKSVILVDLVGYAGAGSLYYSDPKAGQWGVVGQVDAPPGATRVVALRVLGDALEPVYRDGDLLYFSNDPEQRRDASLCVGRDCVVQVAGGQVHIRRVGRLPNGAIRLSAHGLDPIDGAEIEWCAPIQWVRRGGA
jgi:phage repressor protein C with HTH and peptisase S24 domain